MTQTPKSKKTDTLFSWNDVLAIFVSALMFGPLLVSCVVGNFWVAGSLVWIFMWLFASAFVRAINDD